MRSLVLLMLICGPLWCDDWYVAANGGDDANGDGGVQLPFATIGQAVGQAASGDVIRLSAGTHRMDATIDLPQGVDVVGAGRFGHNPTVITNTWTDSFPNGDANEIGYLFKIKNAGGNRLAHFIIDGRDDSLRSGILVRWSSNVVIEDITFTDLSWSAIWVWSHLSAAYVPGLEHYSHDIHIRRCRFVDCGWDSDRYSQAAISLHGIDGGSVTDCEVYNFAENVGYPIGLNFLDNMTVARNRFLVKARSLWNDGAATHFSLGGGAMKRVEIHDNLLNQSFSVTPHRDPDNRGDPYTIRFHHNLVDLYTGYFELSAHDTVIDHNIFTGPGNGYYLVAHWSGDKYELENLLMHHNLIQYCSQVVSARDNTEQGKSGAWRGLRLLNNTIHLPPMSPWQSSSLVSYPFDVAGHEIELRNNVILQRQPGGSHRILDLGGNDGGVQLQASHQLATVYDALPGNDNLEQPHGLALHGNRWEDWYMPSSDSPAYGSGLAIDDITTGAHPHRGAFQTSDSEEDVVGPRLGDWRRPLIRAVHGPTLPGLSWRYWDYDANSRPTVRAAPDSPHGELLCVALLERTSDVAGTAATPDLSIGIDLDEDNQHFGMLFEGYLQAPVSGTYHFRMAGMDQVRLQIQDPDRDPLWHGGWVDVVEKMGFSVDLVVQDRIDLDAGLHRVRIWSALLWNGREATRIDLDWQPPGAAAFTTIPVEQWHRPDADASYRRISVGAFRAARLVPAQAMTTPADRFDAVPNAQGYLELDGLDPTADQTVLLSTDADG